jgi:hypothetical protein
MICEQKPQPVGGIHVGPADAFLPWRVARRVGKDERFQGSVYRSGDPSLPLIVAIFRSGELVAFRKVSSLAEGEALIERAVTLLPLLRDDLPEA